jgi:hypothetical protein
MAKAYQDYKVYVHQKATTGEIFYVGKGRRWRENQKSNRNQHWQKVVAKHGLVVHVVASNLTNEEACTFERLLIQKLGYDTLVNYTIGGEGSEGYKHTEEALNKMRNRQYTDETRQKMSDAKKRNPTRYWLNKKRASSTIKKLKEAFSLPYRQRCVDLLLQGVDRKEIAKETGASLVYLRGIAHKLRKEGYDIDKKVN